MALDPYGRTVIRNLYLDTESYRLIRRSIEKPVYKEKMRIRCYGPAHPDSPVFVELKKKYKKVVYKRRLSLPEQGQQHMLAADIVIPHHLRFIACSGDYRLLIQIHDHCPIILDFHAGSPDSMDSLYHSMKNPRPSRTAV